MIPKRVYEFVGWTGDGYIDLLCAVICASLADKSQPIVPVWACDMLDDYVGMTGCGIRLVDIWMTQHKHTERICSSGEKRA